MNWILFLLLLGWSAIPSGLLIADRLFNLDTHTVIRRYGWVTVIGSIGLLAIAGGTAPRYLELVGWGALAGLLGTIALDIVRLIGLKGGAFPLDMPVMFGFMSLGKARTLQAHVMGRVLDRAVQAGNEKEFVRQRITRIPKLSARQQTNAAAAMMGAISTLTDTRRDKVAQAQMLAMSELSDKDRRAVMTAMDAAGSTSNPGQPRGLPKVPFTDFRAAAAAAVDDFDANQPTLMRRVRTVGYVWHALNGISFGIGYALLAGSGSWGWAIAWGVFVWLAMMVTMPPMMPVLRFPGWFPIVPLVAHVAMILPFAALIAWVGSAANQASLIGWLTT